MKHLDGSYLDFKYFPQTNENPKTRCEMRD